MNFFISINYFKIVFIFLISIYSYDFFGFDNKPNDNKIINIPINITNSAYYQYSVFKNYIYAFIAGQFAIIDVISDNKKRYSGLSVNIYYSRYEKSENNINFYYKNNGDNNWKCVVKDASKMECKLNNENSVYKFYKLGSSIPYELSAFVVRLGVTKCIDTKQFNSFFSSSILGDAITSEVNEWDKIKNYDEKKKVSTNWKDYLPLVSNFTKLQEEEYIGYFIDNNNLIIKKIINNEIVITSKYKYISNGNNIKFELNKEQSGYIFKNNGNCNIIRPDKFINYIDIKEHCPKILNDKLEMKKEFNGEIQINKNIIEFISRENKLNIELNSVEKERFDEILSLISLIKKDDLSKRYISGYEVNNNMYGAFTTESYTIGITSDISDDFGNIGLRCYKDGYKKDENGLYNTMPLGYFWKTTNNNILFSNDEDHKLIPPNVEYNNVFKSFEVTEDKLDSDLTKEFQKIVKKILNKVKLISENINN